MQPIHKYVDVLAVQQNSSMAKCGQHLLTRIRTARLVRTIRWVPFHGTLCDSAMNLERRPWFDCGCKWYEFALPTTTPYVDADLMRQQRAASVSSLICLEKRKDLHSAGFLGTPKVDQAVIYEELRCPSS